MWCVSTQPPYGTSMPRSAPMYDLFENNNKHPLTGANGSPLKARKERSLEVG